MKIDSPWFVLSRVNLYNSTNVHFIEDESFMHSHFHEYAILFYALDTRKLPEFLSFSLSLFAFVSLSLVDQVTILLSGNISHFRAPSWREFQVRESALSVQDKIYHWIRVNMAWKANRDTNTSKESECCWVEHLMYKLTQFRSLSKQIKSIDV